MANERGALMVWWILTPGGVWYNKTAYSLIGCIGVAISTEDNGHGRKVCQDRGDIKGRRYMGGSLRAMIYTNMHNVPLSN